MRGHIRRHIDAIRRRALPEELRRRLKTGRRERGWSQSELGERLGLSQAHISGIESGKIVPRYDTLLEIVRMLGYDLMIVPRALVPAVQLLVTDHLKGQADEAEERPLYAAERDDQDTGDPRNEI